MSSQCSFSYSKPSLNISFSVDDLNLDLVYVFDPDQDLFHHHVFRGEDTRASFISFLSASLQNAGISVFKDDYTVGFDGFVVINSRCNIIGKPKSFISCHIVDVLNDNCTHYVLLWSTILV
ncbi:hypothetical protein TSUD_262700 [Trifolium subterraneum]|nr:hypothetical protein TSUD_262700 [Trifolium subterraneum]